jgi:hypothetical protein
MGYKIKYSVPVWKAGRWAGRTIETLIVGRKGRGKGGVLGFKRHLKETYGKDFKILSVRKTKKKF